MYISVMLQILDSFFIQPYFGIELWRILVCAGILIASFIAGKLLYKVSKTIGRKLTAKSKSNIDDLILDIIEEPIVFVLFIIGLQIGFAFLGLTDPFIVDLFGSITYILILMAIAYTAIKSIDEIIEVIVKPMVSKTDSKLDDQILPILSKVFKLAVVLFTILAIVSHLGQDITAILAGLGIGGLALAFAAQSTISDIFG